jgi:hypothetical protein
MRKILLKVAIFWLKVKILKNKNENTDYNFNLQHFAFGNSTFCDDTRLSQV